MYYISDDRRSVLNTQSYSINRFANISGQQRYITHLFLVFIYNWFKKIYLLVIRVLFGFVDSSLRPLRRNKSLLCALRFIPKRIILLLSFHHRACLTADQRRELWLLRFPLCCFIVRLTAGQRLKPHWSWTSVA